MSHEGEPKTMFVQAAKRLITDPDTVWTLMCIVLCTHDTNTSASFRQAQTSALVDLQEAGYESLSGFLYPIIMGTHTIEELEKAIWGFSMDLRFDHSNCKRKFIMAYLKPMLHQRLVVWKRERAATRIQASYRGWRCRMRGAWNPTTPIGKAMLNHRFARELVNDA
jgi:hypothetical protein